MSKYLLFVFFLTMRNFSFLVAQDYRRIDSLLRVLTTQQEDTNKVKTYRELGWAYQWSYPDTAIGYGLKGLFLANKLQFERGKFSLLETLTQAFSMKGNYTKGLECSFQALDIALKLNDRQLLANAYSDIGSVYYYAKEYEKALSYYHQVKKTGHFPFGLPLLLEGFIGECYFHLNQQDSAYAYIKRAYDMDVRSTNYHWSTPYYYLAAIYVKRGAPDKAIELYRVARQLEPDKLVALNGYNGIATAFKSAEQFDSAVYYSKKVVIESQNALLSSAVVDAIALLADIYTLQKNADSALKYKSLLLAAKDSLFSNEKVNQLANVAFNKHLQQQEIAAEQERYKNKLQLYVLLVILLAAVLIGVVLYRSNRQRQKAYTIVERQKQETEYAYERLQVTQAQLIQSEKMASLGELTSGIAHEIQNPLNFVNNFSAINRELVTELRGEAKSGNINEVLSLADTIEENETKVIHHGQRADAIVKSMLQHSRGSASEKQPTDINQLAEEHLRLAYHGYRAKDVSFNADLETHYDPSIGKASVVPQEIGRVLLNLFNNAFYAVSEKKKLLNGTFEPMVSISTKKDGNNILVTVKDNGMGMAPKVAEKIFQPFFTTKPTGEGTGLGLSLSYDIITKGHGGKLAVSSREGEGTEFVITLPL